jgi:hypothetical protein
MWYCERCEWCEECILSSNLRNKKYYIENISYAPEAYNRKKQEILSMNREMLKKKYQESKLKTPKKHLDLLMTENVIGDYTKRSKDCSFVCDTSDMEDVKYAQFVKDTFDSQDLDYCCCQTDFSYEISTGWVNMFGCAFSVDIWPNIQHSFYSYSCSTSQHLFGCVGVRNKSYCILNKQYTKEEYEELVPRIIEKMIADGEWGEFFPASLSPLWYDEAAVHEYFPLSREKALEDWFNWSDYEAPFPRVEKIIPASKLPDTIESIPDDILNWAIECEVSKKPFRIIKQELEFYRKHSIPIPRRHPDVRHMDRMKMRNPRKLFERKCDKCGKDMVTTYAPERLERVYCETCYDKEIIG